MKFVILMGFAVAALAVPATAHPHGAKSKYHQGKTHRSHRAKRRYRRTLRYNRDQHDTCSVQPLPHHQDYPYWAACAFTPKSLN